VIYCIWYPSGGFGHFVNALITLRGQNFERPQQTELHLSQQGNSHALDLVAPKYLHDPLYYHFEFDPTRCYTVLIDNGINSQSDRFMTIFPGSCILRLCYDDKSWPVVAATMIIKAMNSSLEQQLDIGIWDTDEPWAKREKYFLYLRDHSLRREWRPDARCTNIDVGALLDPNKIEQWLKQAGITLDSWQDLWHAWRQVNLGYFRPVEQAKTIINLVHDHSDQPLTHITDAWSQAVTYYFIWLEWRFEVPHNDYSDWFTSTGDIVNMLQNHGVIN